MPANADFNPVVVSPYHDEPAAMTGQELMAANPYRPWPARITSITELTATEKLFEFRLIDERIREAFRHEPGQFVELTIFGVGEAPISISSSPSKRGFIELCVRRQLADGSLVRVLAPWCPPFPGFFLYVPSRAQMPAKIRALMDFLMERRALLEREPRGRGKDQPVAPSP